MTSGGPTAAALRGPRNEARAGVVYEVDIDGPQPMRNRQITTAPSAEVRHFVSEVRVSGGPWMTVMTATYTRTA